MKRTTIAMPEELAAALQREADRRRVSVSQVTRDALAEHLGFGEGTRPIPFAALGSSGERHTARDAERILEREWSGARGRRHRAALRGRRRERRRQRELARGASAPRAPARHSTMVVAQATYLVGTRLGPTAEASFLRALGDFHVEPPYPEDWTLTADLVDSYADLPLGGTDAATVALAARIDATTAITLDRRQLSAIRPPHCPAFRILPE